MLHLPWAYVLEMRTLFVSTSGNPINIDEETASVMLPIRWMRPRSTHLELVPHHALSSCASRSTALPLLSLCPARYNPAISIRLIKIISISALSSTVDFFNRHVTPGPFSNQQTSLLRDYPHSFSDYPSKPPRWYQDLGNLTILRSKSC